MIDHLLAGGGLAGSTLALRLVRDGLGTVALVDRAEHDPRTFAFWSEGPLEGVEDLIEHQWERLRIVGDGRQLDLPLGTWRYAIVRADAVRQRAREGVLAAGGRVVKGEIERIDDSDGGATVVVDGEALAARWVYDSRTSTHEDAELLQSFDGWWIETDADAFDPAVATLMDFRAAQEPGGVRFFHVLPTTTRRALVSGVDLAPAPREQDVAAYLRDVLGLERWRVVGREAGVTPMDPRAHSRRTSDHVVTVGIRGGRLKASTGYAFARIRHDADAVVASLVRAGHPFELPGERWIWRLLDAVLLRVIARHGPATERIFVALFAHNPPDRVLRFLDERATLRDVLAVGRSLPAWRWFLRETCSLLLARRVQ